LRKKEHLGIGEAVEEGVEKHKQIHNEMSDFQTALIRMRRLCSFGHGGME